MNQDLLSKAPYEQRPLPNSTASLVLGILSIVMCAAYGILGVILGGIGLYLSNGDKKLYQMDPGSFSPGSVSNMNAGRVCSIIGLIMGSIFLAVILIAIIFGLSYGAFK